MIGFLEEKRVRKAENTSDIRVAGDFPDCRMEVDV